MTRELTDHLSSPNDTTLAITVLDEPGKGGACHAYAISGLGEDANPFFAGKGDLRWQDEKLIVFQNGPIAEVGVNGITHEALLAILIDRMRAFQAGPYACEEDGYALTHLLDAQASMHRRTKRRMERGVEGTHEV